MELEAQIESAKSEFQNIKTELRKKIVGNEDIIEGILTCLMCNGHALLEGPPGLGKTSIIKSIGDALHLQFSRIQFTPDLMPADIIGTRMVMEDEAGKRFFEFQQGPIFANIILADEINRATPKTQSALLEAMQEATVTVGREEFTLAKPFLVLATQNPIEMEGTYPLPEAQLDRFLMKLVMQYPSRKDLEMIVDKTTEAGGEEIQAVMKETHIKDLQELVLQIPISSPVKEYAIRLILGTQPEMDEAIPETKKYIRYGSSPRGLQSIIMSAKCRALFEGRINVSFDDVRAVAAACLRHRIILNFEGEAEGFTTENLVEFLLKAVQPE